MSEPYKYNWKGTGPSGCDSHCIPHPCGPCITGKSSKMHYERDLYKSAGDKLAESIQYYFDVLREVRGKDWAKKPDHVLSKMISALKQYRGKK